MSRIEVSARCGTKETDPSATVEYDFGDNLDEAVERFGADAVYSRFKSASTVDVQALIRRHLEGDKPKTVEEIQALVDEWKPGLATRKRKSVGEKIDDLLENMSESDKAAAAAALRERLAALEAA